MPINETLFTTIFFALFGMVLVWFILVRLLFKRREAAHPAKYELWAGHHSFYAIAPLALSLCSSSS